MNNQNSNTFLAMGLSMLVLVVWWVFYLNPKVEEERRIAELEAQRQQTEQSVTTNDNTQSGVIPQNDNAASIPD
ncbi:MAG: membrane protein insertase YidC, partial [Pseudomonadota bacterium]